MKNNEKKDEVMLDIANIFESASDAIFSAYFALRDCVMYCNECGCYQTHYIVRNETVCDECGCRSVNNNNNNNNNKKIQL